MSDAHKIAMMGVLRHAMGARRWRITRDPEGYPIVKGRAGQLEPHCDGEDCHGCPMPGPLLAVWSDKPRQFAKIWAIPGVRRWQIGDKEMRALFQPEAADQVAAAIRVRKRKRISADHLQKLRRGLVAATSSAEKATEPANPGT
jgi:hypothetical protein